MYLTHDSIKIYLLLIELLTHPLHERLIRLKPQAWHGFVLIAFHELKLQFRRFVSCSVLDILLISINQIKSSLQEILKVVQHSINS